MQQMHHSLAILINFLILHFALSHSLPNVIPAKDPYDIDSKYFVQLAEESGFVATGYTVTTDDGYEIYIFRMRANNCSTTKGYPIILMHGLFQCADSWLDGGQNGSLAFCFAEDCNDLWVANVRGTYYGRRHVKLNPDTDRKFWEFSLDEIGMYDVPAQTDFVLKTTGQNKVNYVGYSQGGGTFLIACLQVPGFMDKINFFVGVSPATRLNHTTNILSRIVATSLEKLQDILPKRGDDQELLYRGSILQVTRENICDLRIDLGLENELCTSFTDLIDNPHPKSMTRNTTEVLYHHLPAGVSLHQLIHYGQLMRSRHFRKYSFGKKKNLAKYGSTRSSVYDLTKVTVPAMCVHGYNDGLVNTIDFDWMVGQLQNVVNVTRVTSPLWNHIDMGYNKNVRYVIYPSIRENMAKYNS